MPRSYFLNWCLSKEGQTFMIKELGNLHLAEGGAGLSRRLRSQGGQNLAAQFDEYVKLHSAWVAEWDKTFGYRQ